MLKFSFPEPVVEAFTVGDCWSLACEVEYLSGYAVTVLLHSGNDYDEVNWFHAGNRLLDGRILDIEGVWEEVAWRQRWTARADGGDPAIAHWEREWLLEQVAEDTEPGKPLLRHPDFSSMYWAPELLKLVP
jgi:hypothetical protein